MLQQTPPQVNTCPEQLFDRDAGNWADDGKLTLERDKVRIPLIKCRRLPACGTSTEAPGVYRLSPK